MYILNKYIYNYFTVLRICLHILFTYNVNIYFLGICCILAGSSRAMSMERK